MRSTQVAIGLRYRVRTEDCSVCAADRAALRTIKRMVREMSLINALREAEGASVEISCSNPEGPPNEAVAVVDDWTGWVGERFTGETLVDALEAALKARGEVRAGRGQP